MQNFALSQSYLGSSFLKDLSRKPWAFHRDCFLANHLAENIIFTSQFGGTIETLAGGALPSSFNSGKPTINGLLVSDGNITVNNGVIHVISQQPIQPPCIGDNIHQRLQSMEEFEAFSELFDLAGLASTLGSLRPVSLLAPTNSVLNSIKVNTPYFWEYLIDGSNVQELRNILEYHMIVDNIPRFFHDEIKNPGNFVTQTGLFIEVTYDQTTDTFIAAGAATLDRQSLSNILAQNGLIHTIDSLLIPPGFTLPPTMAPVTPHPTKVPTFEPVTQVPSVTLITTAPTNFDSVVSDPLINFPTTSAPIITDEPIGEVKLPTSASPVSLAPLEDSGTVVSTASPNIIALSKSSAPAVTSNSLHAVSLLILIYSSLDLLG
eukprot:CAMPEP_0202475484 /NCGR_PEP_ID=MMETSP1360-20130828/92925_1 /ASSEMBLY_ACC=CAM_ASM_000848 /TAXON_ID=515479 /ORGANISM="Licmophora paradoxa, Strain CCMP2313" /LENGTH=375 /DNA_ID=CAMNT_0049102649 /DNA_START=424 /DNA_END=1551 /DNA_ORIENTATION=-